jgi:Zn-dependent protease with chaperone function
MEDHVDTRVETGDEAVARPLKVYTSTSSLRWLAALAILLVIGYYILSVVMVAVLLVIAYFSLHLGPAGLVPSMFCLAAAIAIFISILPRIDRYKPSGVQIAREAQPTLYEAISNMAQTTGQRMPARIYVMSHLNAWVTERGGFMGFGRRRYLSIGLPVFPLLTTSQLEGLLAHEFGHFYNGDLKLGPWIYRTRKSMVRTLKNISSTRYSFFAGLIYMPYVEIFMYITQAIARRQEYRADELAARAVGREAVIEALHFMHIGDDAFRAYWESAVRPLISQGARPPLMEGFRRFTGNKSMVESLARKAQTRLKEDKTDDYDSHPALPDRVAAVELLPAVSERGDDSSALTLLTDCEALELAFLNERLTGAKAEQLKLVGWDDVLEQVYIPMWRSLVDTYAEGLAGVTPDSLPEIIKNLTQFTTVMAGKARRRQSFDSSGSWHERASTTIGAAVALALRKAGWTLSMAPGEPVVATRDGRQIRPFEALGRLMSGNLTADVWREQCTSAGIQRVDFGKLVADAPASRLN